MSLTAQHKYQVKTSRIYWWLLIPLMFLLIVLGSRGLHQVLWVDEVRSLYRAGDPVFGGAVSPAQVWQRTAEVFDQVPGYYYVLAAWGSVAGLSHFATRYLSIFFGLLAIAWTYRLGKDLHSPLAGFAAAVALASSVIFVNHLHNMRTYSLLVLLSALLIWLYWRVAIVRKAGWPLNIGLTLSIAGMLYAHYFSAVLIGALCFYHLIFVRKDRHWWLVTGLIAVAGVLFLPWVLTSFAATKLDNMVIRTANAFTPVEAVQQTLDNFTNGNIGLWVFVALFSWLIGGRSVRLVWVLVVVSLLLAMAINAWLFVLTQANYLMMLWVPLALIVGFGAARLQQIGLRPAFLLGVWLLLGVASNFDPRVQTMVNPPLKYLPWDILAPMLEPRAQDGDALVFQTAVPGWTGDPEPVMNYYFHGSPLDLHLLESLPIMTDAEYLRRAQAAVTGAHRVWAAYDPHYGPWRNSMFESLLNEEGFVSCGRITDTDDLSVELYTRPSAELTVRFTSGEVGVTADMHLVELRAAEQVLYVTLEWNLSDALPPNTYSIGVHVVDSAGTLAVQADYGLPTSAFSCTATQISIAALAPGDYSVRAVVYAWETGTRLLDAANDEDSVTLGTFHVD